MIVLMEIQPCFLSQEEDFRKTKDVRQYLLVSLADDGKNNVNCWIFIGLSFSLVIYRESRLYV